MVGEGQRPRPEDRERVRVRSGVRAQGFCLPGQNSLLCPKLPSDCLTQHRGAGAGGPCLSTGLILQSWLAGCPLVQARAGPRSFREASPAHVEEGGRLGESRRPFHRYLGSRGPAPVEGVITSANLCHVGPQGA